MATARGNFADIRTQAMTAQSAAQTRASPPKTSQVNVVFRSLQYKLHRTTFVKLQKKYNLYVLSRNFDRAGSTEQSRNCNSRSTAGLVRRWRLSGWSPSSSPFLVGRSGDNRPSVWILSECRQDVARGQTRPKCRGWVSLRQHRCADHNRGSTMSWHPPWPTFLQESLPWKKGAIVGWRNRATRHFCGMPSPGGLLCCHSWIGRPVDLCCSDYPGNVRWHQTTGKCHQINPRSSNAQPCRFQQHRMGAAHPTDSSGWAWITMPFPNGRAWVWHFSVCNDSPDLSGAEAENLTRLSPRTSAAA